MRKRGCIVDYWLRDGIQEEENARHTSLSDICYICKTPGYFSYFGVRVIYRMLLLCSGPCGRGFHFRCVHLQVIFNTLNHLEIGCNRNKLVL